MRAAGVTRRRGRLAALTLLLVAFLGLHSANDLVPEGHIDTVGLDLASAVPATSADAPDVWTTADQEGGVPLGQLLHTMVICLAILALASAVLVRPRTDTSRAFNWRAGLAACRHSGAPAAGVTRCGPTLEALSICRT